MRLGIRRDKVKAFKKNFEGGKKTVQKNLQGMLVVKRLKECLSRWHQLGGILGIPLDLFRLCLLHGNRRHMCALIIGELESILSLLLYHECVITLKQTGTEKQTC